MKPNVTQHNSTHLYCYYSLCCVRKQHKLYWEAYTPEEVFAKILKIRYGEKRGKRPPEEMEYIQTPRD